MRGDPRIGFGVAIGVIAVIVGARLVRHSRIHRTALVLALLVEQEPQPDEGVGVLGIGGQRGAERVDRALAGQRPIHQRDAGQVPQPGPGGGPKGDLYLVTKVLPHETFQRVEDDLNTEVPVPLVTAMLGGEVEVPTLKAKVALQIPPETQNGKLIRLSGQGMRHLGDSTLGDLYVRVKVVLPVNLTEAERRLFQQLRSLRP